MRLLCKSVLLSSLFLAFGPCYGRCGELNLYIWDDYISRDVVQKFEETTGLTVKQVNFDSDKTRDETMASASGRKFDIVLMDNVAVQIFGKNNQLLAINGNDVPHLNNIDPQWRESCGNFGVPYFWGTTGIVYDKTKYPDVPPDSWRDLLQPKSPHQGHVCMIEDLSDTLVPALIYLGYNINTENKQELKNAYELLRGQVPSVLNYTYALTNVKLADKERQMDIAFAYSGDQYALNEESGTENWEYVIPREGTTIWMDCLAITAWSDKKEDGLRFLNYLLEPKVAAMNTEEIYNGTPISAIKEFLPAESRNDPALFLSEDIRSKAQVYRILSDNSLRQRGRIIDTLRKRHEAQ